jgi:hypothetical protein
LIERVKDRAQARLDEAKARAAEEERKARLGPGGLDPIEVLASLPSTIREAFETQDTAKLQAAFAALPPEEAKLHFKRVVDSGLWVPGAGGLVPRWLARALWSVEVQRSQCGCRWRFQLVAKRKRKAARKKKPKTRRRKRKRRRRQQPVKWQKKHLHRE